MGSCGQSLTSPVGQGSGKARQGQCVAGQGSTAHNLVPLYPNGLMLVCFRFGFDNYCIFIYFLFFRIGDNYFFFFGSRTNDIRIECV